MEATEGLAAKKDILWKVFLAFGILAVTPFALWLICIAVGGCKALLGG